MHIVCYEERTAYEMRISDWSSDVCSSDLKPLSSMEIRHYAGGEGDIATALEKLADHYAERGVHLVERGGHWHFQTAPDLAHILRKEREEPRKLSRAAMETQIGRASCRERVCQYV